MALSRLARLALNSVCDSPPNDRAEVYQLVATATHEECPDISELATKAATHLHAVHETEAELLDLLKSS